MKLVDFVFAGERQTYWGLYFGWGLLVAVLLLSTALTLWLMSGLVRVAPREVGFITGGISATSLAGCFISLQYFYAPPTAFFAVLFVLLLAPTIQLIRGEHQKPRDGRSAIEHLE